MAYPPDPLVIKDADACSCVPDNFSPGRLKVAGDCPKHGFFDSEGKWIHPNDLSREALRELVADLSWMALDLGQHLCFLNLQFDEGGRKGPSDDAAAGYIEAQKMAYAISSLPYDGPEAMGEIRRTPGIGMVDGKGGFSL